MKRVVFAFAPFIVQAAAVAANFNAAAQGSYAGGRNILVTCLYIAFWLYFLRSSRAGGRSKALAGSAVLWTVVFLQALLLLAGELIGFDLSMMIPFSIVFMTPLYGLRIPSATYAPLFVAAMCLSAAYTAYAVSGGKGRKK